MRLIFLDVGRLALFYANREACLISASHCAVFHSRFWNFNVLLSFAPCLTDDT